MVKVLICIYFGGETFNNELDGARLKKQLNDVFVVMGDNHFRTLHEIHVITSHPIQSILARLRDLRKAKFGGYQVNRRRRGHGFEGILEYQVLPSYK